MARKRKRTRSSRSGLPVGAQPPAQLGELIAAIAGVNPTGLALPAAERDRRYAHKTHLQGELIERFAADLAVWQDEQDVRLVLLACRRTLHSAGHAVIDELDPQARSWVHRQIDLGQAVRPALAPASVHTLPADRAASARRRDGSTGTSSSGGVGQASVGAALASGEAALAAYDYPAAESGFRAALAGSGGAVGPARALLALLVDHLAADEEAMALGVDLPPASRSDPRVAGMLLVAAARAGAADPDPALLRCAEVERRGTALALHCGAALASDRLGQAERWLDAMDELALRDGAALLTAGESEQAWALLQPHSVVLGDLRHARELQERAKGEAAESVEARVVERLVRAEALLETGELDQAAELVGRVREETPAALQELTDELGRRLDVAMTVRRLRQRERSAIARGALLEARDCLLGLARHVEERAALDQRLVALDAEIGRTWRVRSFAGDLGDVPRDALNWTRSEGRPSRWLMRDERIGLIATVIPRWHQPRELPPGGYGSARRLHVPRQR